MLKIQIIGSVGAGKTTLSSIIEKALRDNGIKVTNLDPDHLYSTVYHDAYPEHQDKRIGVLAERSKSESVVIEVVQTRRVADVEQHSP